jgi:hypothetical protein
MNLTLMRQGAEAAVRRGGAAAIPGTQALRVVYSFSRVRGTRGGRTSGIRCGGMVPGATRTANARLCLDGFH